MAQGFPEHGWMAGDEDITNFERNVHDFMQQTAHEQQLFELQAEKNALEQENRRLAEELKRLRISDEPSLAQGQGSQLSAVLSTLAGVLEQQQVGLPKKEPEVFKGDVFAFTVWLNSYEVLVERRYPDALDRLYYLGKYTSGEARQCIKGFLSLNTSDAYIKAKERLQDRFGNRLLLAQSFRDKMAKWPTVKPNDGKALRDLSDFLCQCETAMDTLGHLKILDDAEEQKKILAKLPKPLQSKWANAVDKWTYGDSLEVQQDSYGPPFSYLCKFVHKQARIACNPLFVQVSSTGASGGSSVSVKNVKAFASNTVTAAGSSKPETSNVAGKVSSQSDTGSKVGRCTLCKSEVHTLFACPRFQAMELAGRVDHVMKAGLCLGCLRWGHRKMDCKHKSKCDRCQRLHPTLLHDESFKPSQSVNTEKQDPTPKSVKVESASASSYCAGSAGGSDGSDCLAHSLIVPVVLCHRDKPQDSIVVYALLDEQSDACFITSSAKEELGLEGDEVNLKLSTVLGEEEVSCRKVNGLEVKGLNEQVSLSLPGVFSRDSIPVKRSQIPRPETVSKWHHLKVVEDNLSPCLDVEIALLIGINCSKAILPLQIVAGEDNEPYGVKTALGWGVVGIMDPMCVNTAEASHFSFRTQVKEVSPSKVRALFDQDFSERTGEPSSVEDRRFLEIVSRGIRRQDDGHFEIPLPFKDDATLPNNRTMAASRLKQLKGKLMKNDQLRADYCDFMGKLISNGYAERAPEAGPEDTVWYLPHHGVYHPRKPTKLRVVFDCAAQFDGEVLNKHLLRGPDLLNNLTGVLTRFRKERVAFTCDIESMFYQVTVPPAQRNYLRFLWWDEGNLREPPVEFCMARHIFGATSSPGVSNFALRATAERFRGEFGDTVADFILRDFYVDDGLKSVPSAVEAATLIKESRSLCSRSGFNLRAYTCNDKNVVGQIPVEYRAKDIQRIDLKHDELPVERTLGVIWNVQSDELGFKVELKERPMTRRGLLSTVSAVFDPLGLIAPFLLKGKRILQSLCTDGCSWDDPIPAETQQEWERWRSDLLNLSEIKIPRCYKTESLDEITAVELHHFSDASLVGYGQCSYVRLTDTQGRSEASLVMAKSRVAPSKSTTVPRLELAAALASAKIGSFLGKELDYKDATHFYYTDSKVVLGYINNESRKFHIFVANRVQQIRDCTSPESWRYVSTDQNPADLASRGMSVEELRSSDLWWNGPPFLASGDIPPPIDMVECPLPPQDPEVKKSVGVFRTGVDAARRGVKGFEYFSTWYKLKKAVALCMKYIEKLRTKDRGHYTPVTVDDLQKAEKRIIKITQDQAYSAEIRALKKCGDGLQRVNKGSSVSSLEPFLDEDSLLRVGGRLRRSSMPDSIKHPILLPKDSHVSRLVIAHHHRMVSHAGRGMTLNSLRQRYWVVGARKAVTLYIMSCVACRKLRGTPCQQKMADLPADRVEAAEPFTYAAVDYFGPFTIKEGRSEPKRWGVLFSCLSSRAIHLETANQLSTDSFLNAYRRFVSRRGPVRLLRCDRGTNFVGGKNELATALKEMDQDKVRQELLKDDCDWVNFEMNFPHSSHMGGAWERMIGTARNVLTALLSQNGHQLDDELLRTLFAEAEAIVNSRPLAVVDSNSPDLEPLSPSQILTLKSQVVKPPPGNFVRQDIYCRKRWRRVQFLANQFWTRWRTEYLTTLQPRKKWTKPVRNLERDDVVLMIDEGLARCQWPLARVVEVFPSSDGLVRKVKLLAKGKTYERPIHKVVLLLEKSDVKD